VFLGYSLDHRGYCYYDLASRRVLISRHVVFDESDFPFSSSSKPTLDPSDLGHHGLIATLLSKAYFQTRNWTEAIVRTLKVVARSFNSATYCEIWRKLALIGGTNIWIHVSEKDVWHWKFRIVELHRKEHFFNIERRIDVLVFFLNHTNITFLLTP
jgi:hypothetical protein